MNQNKEAVDAMLGRSESFERVRAVEMSLKKFAESRCVPVPLLLPRDPP